MTISNTQAVIFALTPGLAEVLRRNANYAGNLAWHGMATGVIWSRNGMYISAGLTAISVKGTHKYSEEKYKYRRYGCIAVTVLSAALMSRSSYGLYYFTKMIQKARNAGFNVN